MLRSILLVDDSEIDNFVNRKMIELANLAENTVSITSPVKALEYLKRLDMCEPHNVPELIFLDLNMPYMNGFEFLAELESIAEQDGFPRVVMLSSSVDERDVELAKQYSSVLSFANKPLTVAFLHSLEVHLTFPVQYPARISA